MKTKRLPILFFLCLFALSACANAFGQRPGGGPPGGGPPGGRPGGGPPQGGGPPPGGPERGRRPDGQQGPPPGGRPPLGPQADLLSSEMRFGDRLVKGAPYSAQFTAESIQTLGDGTRITRKSTGAVYRNGEGRTRREQTLGAIGPIAIEGEPQQVIFINDPIVGAHYVLEVNNHKARKLPYLNAPPAPPQMPSDFDDKGDPIKTESLGKQMIEGVEAEGTRSTITIPAGRVGNDRPLEIVSERWYSPELQVVVLSKHKDPFAGENVYRLTGIIRDEPPHTLFEVPAGYSIVDEGPPPRNGPRRPE